MIYVFYSNDPLHNDQGGGVEHLRGIYRALSKSDLDYRFVVSRMAEHGRQDDAVTYISTGSNFLKYYFALWRWFLKNRGRLAENDVFHFHRNYAAWPKYVLAAGKGKVIITYHGLTGFVIKDAIGALARPVRSIMKYFEKKSLAKADVIIFVSDRDRQSMRDSMLAGNYEKSVVIPAAFDSSIFGDSSQPPAGLHNKVLMVGRIARIKNIPLAIDAIAVLLGRGVTIELEIAGDGEDRSSVEQHAEKSPCSANIRFLGMVSHHEIPALMKRNGIVLLTSHSEASPTVVKEAIVASRPVVTTDVGDVGNWIVNGTNGFICDSTPESIADGIAKAQEMIRDQAYAGSADLAQLSEQGIMQKLLEIYRRCAGAA